MRSSLIVFAGALLLATGSAFAQGTAADAGPTDPQIAQIVVTANQVDIEAGRLAESNAHSKDVSAFGKQMVTDHGAANRQAVALVTQLKVTPEDNPTSQSLKKGGQDNLKNLKTLKGTAFDWAYIDPEVAYHEQVIDVIDKVLVPNAKNEELKALIVKVRPAFVAHLEHAKMIQTKLAK